MVNPHRGSISGRHRSLEKILLLRPNSYADANDWDDLAYAFAESLKDSSLDEMILLVRATIPGQYERRPKYVRLVSYNTLDEVPELLLSVTPNSLRSGTTSVRQQRPYVKVVTRVQSNSDHTGRGQEKRVEMPQERIVDGTEADMSGRDHKEEINEIRDPLAHVLQCLDVIKAFAESEKKEAKRRMMTEDNKNLEELTGTLNKHRCDDVYCTLLQGSNKSSSKLLKKTIALRKKLSPSSKVPEGQSVSDLQHEVLEVKAIVEGLDNIPGSIETRNRIKKCWD